jgi:hypothetical protein
VKGPAPIKVVIRALGPSLEVNGQPVAGRLLNPTLELYNKNSLVYFNDDWIASPQKAQIQASGLAPKDIHEAAIIATLPEGSYTAVISGKNQTAGIALGEIYALPQKNTESELINLSARGLVLTGDGVLIDGVVIGGKTSKEILVRAIGPELRAHGVSGELLNPMLDLYDANGRLVRRNDNWHNAPNLAKIQSSGFAPTNNYESAILMTLAPGRYTAIVRGVNGGTGVALAEIYMLH